MLRPTNLPAHEGPWCSLSQCMDSWLYAPQIMARPSRTAQASPAGSWNCGVPSHKPADGGKSLFVCISVMTLARKPLRLIAPDLSSEVLLQSITFSKFGEEIESALFQGESYEFITVTFINVGQLILHVKHL